MIGRASRRETSEKSFRPASAVMIMGVTLGMRSRVLLATIAERPIAAMASGRA
jgi:hypothetical protein